MCILVVTTSFTSGLSDILFNRVLVYMTGHIAVQELQYTTRRTDVIRDKDRIIALIRQNVEGIKSIDEGVGAFGRTIGNGRTGHGLPGGPGPDSEFYDQTALEAGDPRDIYKPDVFPGIILYKNAARDLNVGMNDTVTARFETVYGQSQAVKFKVVGVIPSENMFMDMAGFVDSEVPAALPEPAAAGGDQPVGGDRVPRELPEGDRHGQPPARGAPAPGRRGQGQPGGGRPAGGGRGVRPGAERASRRPGTWPRRTCASCRAASAP